MRHAFTMVELIFSLVVISIVSMIGSDVIRHVYESYAFSKQVEITQNDLRRTLDLIATRLSYRVKNSVVAVDDSWTNIKAIDDAAVESGKDTTLVWVGTAYESSRHMNGWSGFAQNKVGVSGDIDLSLYVSNFSHAQLIEKEFLDIGNTRIVFAGEDRRGTVIGDLTESFGYKSFVNSSYFKFSVSRDDLLNVKPNAGAITAPISDFFYVTRSAYAIRVDDGNLTLYYNFRPWLNEGIDKAQKTVLLENVRVFQFAQMGDVLRLSICNNFPKDGYFNVGAFDDALFCRERSVF